MGVWHPVDMRPRGPFPEEPLAAQLAKARRFSACAELFRRDAVLHPSAIRSIIGSYSSAFDQSSMSPAMEQSGNEALAWFAANPGSDVLGREYVRLFGGTVWTREMPLIPPCACSYLSEPVDGTVADVLAAYDTVGFVPRTENGRCPAHISNELDFVSHCMTRVASGDPAGVAAAHVFVVTHLFHWGVVFAAATYARAELPPYRFAGAALEHILFGALDHATESDEPHCTVPMDRPS